MAAAATLAQVDLFSVLTPGELAGLAARVRRRRYTKGTVIFLQGEPGNILYVIEAGRVRIVIASPEGRELEIAEYGPGEFVGDMALLDGEPRSADAIAAEDCQLAILQREDFTRFIETHPQAAVRLLPVLSRRLRRVTRQLIEATLFDVFTRVARELLRLAADQGRRVPATGGAASGSDAIFVERPMTQVELATRIGVTRESVNKALSFFRQQGWILWEKGQLTILRVEELGRRYS